MCKHFNFNILKFVRPSQNSLGLFCSFTIIGICESISKFRVTVLVHVWIWTNFQIIERIHIVFIWTHFKLINHFQLSVSKRRPNSFVTKYALSIIIYSLEGFLIFIDQTEIKSWRIWNVFMVLATNVNTMRIWFWVPRLWCESTKDIVIGWFDNYQGVSKLSHFWWKSLAPKPSLVALYNKRHLWPLGNWQSSNNFFFESLSSMFELSNLILNKKSSQLSVQQLPIHTNMSYIN